MNWKEQLLDAGRAMLRKGLTVETWGNLSLRDAETGRVYLTPSAMPYDALGPDDVVVTDPDGNVLEGTRKPTVEAGLHLGVYRARGDVHAILHTHPIWSAIFAALRRDIPPIVDEAAQVLGGTVRVAEYALPGTERLAQNALAALGDGGMACLLANHGAVCLGADMAGAFKTAAVLEMTAQIYHGALCIGTPAVIAPEDVAAMREFMAHRYGQGR